MKEGHGRSKRLTPDRAWGLETAHVRKLTIKPATALSQSATLSRTSTGKEPVVFLAGVSKSSVHRTSCSQ